jgi:hypothetical protein
LWVRGQRYPPEELVSTSRHWIGPELVQCTGEKRLREEGINSLATIPSYDREEIARIGDETYERKVLPNLGPEDEGKFALIDIRTGDYEIDRDEIAASDRLLSRHPDAQVWTRQVGSRYARRFGPRFKTTAA